MTFIDEHSDRFAVALLLRVLQIGESTYYAWKQQAAQPCDRDLVDLALISNIHEIWEASGRTYGADRVHRQLRRDGIRVGRKRVERLMKQQGWQGAFLRRGWRGGSTRQDPRHTPAPDLVNRDFTPAAPNRLWVDDATRIPCGEGAFWLAAVRDVFSRRIVGWKTSDRCDTDLILSALEYGIWSRDVRDGQLIHHSDRGSNYTSFRFSQRLADNGIAASIRSVGDSSDNALMENFWSTLKIELVYRTSWRTRDEAENALFAYIDGWYNTRRIQRELGYLSPDEYETAWHARQTTQTPADIITPAPTGGS
ncbi:IS3 family transposase [Actinoplanes sp. NPDC049548]|uniref:IS3 family transposase n=1 Tax=Actinoplanes sp. NPDC049548 TaxID=3155152 RepID=UPI003445F191